MDVHSYTRGTVSLHNRSMRDAYQGRVESKGGREVCGKAILAHTRHVVAIGIDLCVEL